MARLRSKHGKHAVFVHEGVEHKADEHGFIEVEGRAIEVAKSHGFVDEHHHVAPKHEDVAELNRGEIGEMLAHLGVAIADSALPIAKMVEMLKAAVKAKVEVVEKDVEKMMGDSKPAAGEAEHGDANKHGKNRRG